MNYISHFKARLGWNGNINIDLGETCYIAVNCIYGTEHSPTVGFNEYSDEPSGSKTEFLDEVN
jgi:hypothetical protein